VYVLVSADDYGAGTGTVGKVTSDGLAALAIHASLSLLLIARALALAVGMIAVRRARRTG
jgi:hypothetical protein